MQIVFSRQFFRKLLFRTAFLKFFQLGSLHQFIAKFANCSGRFFVSFENVQGLGGQRGWNDQRSRLVGVIKVIRVVVHGGQVGGAVR